MIPIECPKCGRGGNIPPDRLNARLVCKACHSVFHMDNSGKLMLGEPGAPDRRANRNAEAAKAAKAGPDFEFSDIGKNIPPPVRYGVPVAALVAVLWYLYGSGPGEPDYMKNAETLVRAVVANDRPKALSYATAGTADGAGKWFDMVHGAMATKNISQTSRVVPTLWQGDPTKSAEIMMSVIIADPATSEQFPVPLNIHMNRAGSHWAMDGNKTLTEAEKDFAVLAKKPSR